MKFAEFLVANQDWVAPLIEWGGLLLILLITLSPFLIIRHRVFKPTRWWHIVGAYASSFALLALTIWLFVLTDQWVIENYLTTFELSGALDDAFMYLFLLLLFLYPISIFYSGKMLVGKSSKKQFIVTFVIFILFIGVLYMVAYNLFVYAVGQAFMSIN